MDNMKDNTYYKYRNLKDFERFLDVVINNRMYGAKPRELNDPMEGKFNKTNLSQDDFKEIRNELKNTRICSLLTKQKDQTFPNDYLMWSHYADNHNGCCIEVQITGRYNTGWELHEIQYQNNMPSLDGLSGNKGTLTSSIWTDRNGENHIQHSIIADSIAFVNAGKKDAADNTASKARKAVKAEGDAPEPPADAPQDKSEDLPF